MTQSLPQRPLTEQETQHIPQFIAKSIALPNIRIVNRPWTWLTPPRITVARGYNIFWPGAPRDAVTVAQIAHLVHEVVHVWQYKHLGVGMYSWRWLDRRYGYLLRGGEDFLRFGLEQQASIIEDMVRLQNGLPHRHARNAPPLDVFEKMVRPLAAEG